MRYIYFFILVCDACTNSDTKLNNETNDSLSIKILSANVEKIVDTNFTDKNGLKQGLWITKDTIYNFTKVRTYKNDTLEGIAKNYEERPKHILLGISFYSKNKLKWSIMPNYFEKTTNKFTHVFALKGIVIHEDSIYVKIPHENGRIWIEGSYIHLGNNCIDLPTGELKSYYKNGQLKTIENWKVRKKIDEYGRVVGTSNLNGKYIMYDSTGNILLDTVFKMAHWIIELKD